MPYHFRRLRKSRTNRGGFEALATAFSPPSLPVIKSLALPPFSPLAAAAHRHQSLQEDEQRGKKGRTELHTLVKFTKFSDATCICNSRHIHLCPRGRNLIKHIFKRTSNGLWDLFSSLSSPPSPPFSFPPLLPLCFRRHFQPPFSPRCILGTDRRKSDFCHEKSPSALDQARQPPIPPSVLPPWTRNPRQLWEAVQK